ncbi:P-loop containing nucleoside triphosphate hydrolase protein [Ilyonectria sp. MPI-CAGE-AT-0026]|nr:P-loop containing nucleoside triphosphate hydrolase protein [Ilyonectria sp. MPI-CAGE-AT-0026]
MDTPTEFHGPVTGHYAIPAPHASHGGSNNFYFNRRDTSSPAPKPCHIIPFPRNEDIVHRPDLFVELETLLPSMTSEYHSAALWGLGGSGKTQIALEYAYRRCRDPACSVFWVHADNATTFTHDYKMIGRKLGLDSKVDGEDLLVAVRERIESEPRYLFVLDNADDLALFGVGQKPDKSDKPTILLEYIPRSPTGMVLWTSRDERIAGTLVGPPRGIGVARMTVDEGRALLEMARKTKTTSEELDDATALLEELQWLPLAISQAGAYMRRTSTSLNEYLSRLVEGKERWCILNETELDRHRRLDVPNSILETWHISIDRIRQENEMAYKILHTIAYLDNQNIPWEVIAAAGTFDNNRRRGQPSDNAQLVDRAIIRLKEFSFVAARRTEGGERSFEMHKLVQEAVRYGLKTKRLLERKTTKPKLRLRNVITKPFRKHRVAEKGGWEDEPEVYFSNAALQVITDLFPKRMRETWAQCEMLLAHAVRVSDWAELCGKEVEASNLLGRVSNYLYDCGGWRGMEQVDVRVLDLRREVLGAKYPDTIRAMGNLASTYHEQGRYNKAEEIKVKVLEQQRERERERERERCI